MAEAVFKTILVCVGCDDDIVNVVFRNFESKRKRYQMCLYYFGYLKELNL